MKNSILYHIKPINETNRISCLKTNLKHRSYLTRDDNSKVKIQKFINKELRAKYLLSIPKDKVIDISNTKACLIYIVRQYAIDKNRNKMTKDRLYYDLLFSS